MNVGETERPGVVTAADDLAAAVVDQVDLAKTWLVFSPFGPGL